MCFSCANVMSDHAGNKVGDSPLTGGLNRTQSLILAQIRNNPNITKVQLTEAVGVGKTTVDKAIAVLKGNGYIERIGSNKTGYWSILK